MRNKAYQIGILVLMSFVLGACSQFFGTDSKETANTHIKYNRSTATNKVVSSAELSNAAGFPEFRDKVLSFTEADELAQFINSLPTEDYKEAQISQKSLTYILAKDSFKLLKIYRGIFYRMRGLVSKHNFSRTVVVNSLRMSAAGIDTFLPGNQWHTGFNYTTEPYYKSNKNAVLDISDDEAFKRYLVNEVQPALKSYLKTLNFLIAHVEKYPLYWDNILFNQNFNENNADRSTELGLVELKLIKSGVLIGLSSIQSAKAYSLTGFFELMDDVSKKFGMGIIFTPGNALPEKRNSIIKKAIEKGFLSRAQGLSQEQFKKSLSDAYNYAVLGVREAEEAWKILRDEDRDYDKLFKAQSALPFARILNESFMNIKVLAGKSNQDTVVSVVSQGEQVSFNIKKFFLDDPITGENGKSFKDFLPTQYNKESASIEKKIEGSNVQYRNFRQGNPSQWNSEIYKTYFGTDDVKLVNRVLSQSWGSAGFGLTLLPVIM